jgi:hypothetical protein
VNLKGFLSLEIQSWALFGVPGVFDVTLPRNNLPFADIMQSAIGIAFANWFGASIVLILSWAFVVSVDVSRDNAEPLENDHVLGAYVASVTDST